VGLDLINNALFELTYTFKKTIRTLFEFVDFKMKRKLNYANFSFRQAAKVSVIDYLVFYNGRRLNSILAINRRYNLRII
jgi:hypothetical protein